MHNILAAELMKLKKNKMAGTGTLLLCAIPVLAMIKKILIDKDSIGLQEWYLTIFLLQTVAARSKRLRADQSDPAGISGLHPA